jgi:hypothetical protein
MPAADDYYQVLEVDPSAEHEVIRAAYRRLALETHPDRNKSPDATRRMKRLNAAYRVLSDPTARKRYDQELAELRHEEHAQPAPPEPPEQPAHDEEAEALRRRLAEAETARRIEEARERMERAEAERLQGETWGWNLLVWLPAIILLGLLVVALYGFRERSPLVLLLILSVATPVALMFVFSLLLVRIERQQQRQSRVKEVLAQVLFVLIVLCLIPWLVACIALIGTILYESYIAP